MKEKERLIKGGFEFTFGGGIKDMTELSCALIGFWQGEKNSGDILSLMADVYLFLEDLCSIFDNGDEVKKILEDKKAERHRRIEENIVKRGCILQSYGEVKEDG